MPAAVRIALVDDVSGERQAIERLAEAAAAEDSSHPLNEAALLHLRRPREGVRHLLARAGNHPTGDDLVGYAQLERGDDVDTAQLVVAPSARRQGIGRRLLTELTALAGSAGHPLQIWAMGDSRAAAALAGGAGMERVRGLSIMTRRLDDELPEPRLPPGVSLRAFRPGLDEDAWLAVNARAFAHHPEQGRTTRADLAERMAEPWFDPAGFLLAERGEPDGQRALVGFHWTKQHPGRLGEVYVLGVDPAAAGGGLGKALLWAGLRFLRSRGNTGVELYVESDHVVAIGLYAGAGFAESSRDVLYRTSR